MRKVAQILPAQKINMGGILMDQPLPFKTVEQIDPFLLLHHWKDELPGGENQRNLGVGPHPHRGFSPVTFIFEGGVLHQDSRGNKGVISKGGTQWMNSGMGIVHSERPDATLAENGGTFEIIQFWVNTPAKYKMEIPSYQPLSAEETPVIKSDDGLVEISVVCGNVGNVSGKIKAHSDILALRLNIKEGGEINIPVPEHFNAFLYLLDGKLDVQKGITAIGKDLVWYKNEGAAITAMARADTRAILLAGAPIGEKVTQYGPFVMNDQTEIMQAMRDYQMGKMGMLIEEF